MSNGYFGRLSVLFESGLQRVDDLGNDGTLKGPGIMTRDELRVEEPEAEHTG